MLYGCHIPPQVVIGERFHLPHRGMGTVLHNAVTIGDDVTIYHNVNIGRASVGGGKVTIGNRAVLSVGSIILSGPHDVHIGEGAIIGANAVVRHDIPAWEIWAGVPARKIGDRDRDAESPW